ncbi:MAG: phosphopantetheine-binding protein [Acidobacteriota bacterium]
MHSLLGGPIDSRQNSGWSFLSRDTSNGKEQITNKDIGKQLRSFLQARLPEYMLPYEIVIMSELPLSANGKVDRNALPSPNSLESICEESFIEPSNELEESIAKVWQEIMAIEKISVNSNFFELGANSLIIVKAYNKLREKLQRSFPLVAMFKYSTINALARYLSADSVAADSEQNIQQHQDRAVKQREAIGKQQQLFKKFRQPE